MPTAVTKGTYGISGVRAFEITSIGTDGVPVYSATPIDWKGAREVATKPLGADKDFYADNTTYLTIRGPKGIEGTFTAYTMPDSIKTKGLGYVTDLNKAEVVNGTTKKELGLIYELEQTNEDGTTDKELHILYRVTLSDPEHSSKTTEAEADLKEFSVPFKAKEVIDTTNNLIYAEVILKKSVVGSTIYNAALAEMYKPDMVA